MISNSGREFVFVLSADGTELQAVTKKAQGDLGKVADSTTGLDEAQKRATHSGSTMASSLAKVGAGAVGLGAVTSFAMQAADALIRAQVNADRLNLQMGAAVGASKAGQELDYVREVSNRLGLELNSTAVSYARFASAARGTSLEGTAVRQVFESVAKSAAVMGLDVGETEGVLKALEQMMSKGVVQAEELRGQLGDRMPGALQIAARSLGVTTAQLAEMVEQGKVLAVDFLPAFARQLETELGPSAEKAGDRMQGVLNRLSGAWEQLKQTTADAGVGNFFRKEMAALADGLTGASEAMKRAKDAGLGFEYQMAAGAGAALKFANPLNAISYNAQSAAGQLDQARAKAAELNAELASRGAGSVSFYLRADIAQVEALIARLEQAQDASRTMGGNQSAAETARLGGYEQLARKRDEDRKRRMEALGKVTADLTHKNDKLTQSLQVLADAYQAGDLAESDYRRMVTSAYDQFLPKGRKATARDEPPVDHFILDKYDAQAKLVKEAFEKDSKVRDFMLGKVQESDERQQKARERQLDQSTQFAQQMVTGTASIYAQLLPSAEARGQALLAIEKAQLQSRLDTLKLEGTERQLLQDEINRYVIAAETKLTDDLKPEWQRRLEFWQDTNQLMRDSHATLMGGIVDEGEKAFTDWLATGKLSAKNLVRFIGDEFAKLTYRKYLAGSVASGAEGLLKLLGLGAGGGVALGSASGTDLSTFYDMGAVGGGAATGSNFIERDMLTILHKGEAVIPPAFNPWGAGAPAVPRSSAPMVQNVTYNVPPGQSPASYAAALAMNNRQLKDEITADMNRPGRGLQRAAARAGRF